MPAFLSSIGTTELIIIILVIVVLFFGSKILRGIGKSAGESTLEIKKLKKDIKGKKEGDG
jgi:TatA/E family protein of Tat protein translocase